MLPQLLVPKEVALQQQYQDHNISSASPKQNQHPTTKPTPRPQGSRSNPLPNGRILWDVRNPVKQQRYKNIILRQSVLSGLTFLLLLLVTNPTKHIPKSALKEKNGTARGHKHHNNCPIHYATEQLRRYPSTEVQRPAHFADEPPAAGNAGLGMPATPTRQSPRNKRAKRHD